MNLFQLAWCGLMDFHFYMEFCYWWHHLFQRPAQILVLHKVVSIPVTFFPGSWTKFKFTKPWIKPHYRYSVTFIFIMNNKVLARVWCTDKTPQDKTIHWQNPTGQNPTGQNPTHNRTKPHFIHNVWMDSTIFLLQYYIKNIRKTAMHTFSSDLQLFFM